MSRRPTVVVLDYGSGNVRSAQRALQRVGADAEITADADAAREADGLVVPGVGAFAACMDGLLGVAGDQLIAKRLAGSRPVLGICVGMQVLFEAGVEHGLRTPGCGCWPGVVERLTAPVLPHMGWNSVAAPAALACSRASARSSCSTSCTPTRSSGRPAPGPGRGRPPQAARAARRSAARRAAARRAAARRVAARW